MPISNFEPLGLCRKQALLAPCQWENFHPWAFEAFGERNHLPSFEKTKANNHLVLFGTLDTLEGFIRPLRPLKTLMPLKTLKPLRPLKALKFFNPGSLKNPWTFEAFWYPWSPLTLYSFYALKPSKLRRALKPFHPRHPREASPFETLVSMKTGS